MITPGTALLVPRARLKGLHPRGLRGQGQPWELGGEGHPLPWGYEETRPCPRGRSLLCLDGCLWGLWTCLRPSAALHTQSLTPPHLLWLDSRNTSFLVPPSRTGTGSPQGLCMVCPQFTSPTLLRSLFLQGSAQTDLLPCLATASLSTPSSALFLFIII